MMQIENASSPFSTNKYIIPTSKEAMHIGCMAFFVAKECLLNSIYSGAKMLFNVGKSVMTRRKLIRNGKRQQKKKTANYLNMQASFILISHAGQGSRMHIGTGPNTPRQGCV